MLAIYSDPSCNFPQPRQADGLTQHRSPTILRAMAPIRLPANEISALTDH